MASELEHQGGGGGGDYEEVKVNSPSRLRHKPRDHNIFGGTDVDRFQTKSRDYSWSPSRKTEIQRPKDHNIFGVPVDDTYQRNPMKIGHSSLSP